MMYVHVRFLDGTELALPMREGGTKLPCRARLEYVGVDGPHFIEEPTEEDLKSHRKWARRLASDILDSCREREQGAALDG